MSNYYYISGVTVNKVTRPSNPLWGAEASLIYDCIRQREMEGGEREGGGKPHIFSLMLPQQLFVEVFGVGN